MAAAAAFPQSLWVYEHAYRCIDDAVQTMILLSALVAADGDARLLRDLWAEHGRVDARKGRLVTRLADAYHMSAAMGEQLIALRDYDCAVEVLRKARDLIPYGEDTRRLNTTLWLAERCKEVAAKDGRLVEEDVFLTWVQTEIFPRPPYGTIGAVEAEAAARGRSEDLDKHLCVGDDDNVGRYGVGDLGISERNARGEATTFLPAGLSDGGAEQQPQTPPGVGAVFESLFELHNLGLHGGFVAGPCRATRSLLLSTIPGIAWLKADAEGEGMEHGFGTGDVSGPRAVGSGSGSGISSRSSSRGDAFDGFTLCLNVFPQQPGGELAALMHGFETAVEAFDKDWRDRRWPVKVFRCHRLDSPLAPESGYRYDGLHVLRSVRRGGALRATGDVAAPANQHHRKLGEAAAAPSSCNSAGKSQWLECRFERLSPSLEHALHVLTNSSGHGVEGTAVAAGGHPASPMKLKCHFCGQRFLVAADEEIGRGAEGTGRGEGLAAGPDQRRADEAGEISIATSPPCTLNLPDRRCRLARAWARHLRSGECRVSRKAYTTALTTPYLKSRGRNRRNKRRPTEMSARLPPRRLGAPSSTPRDETDGKRRRQGGAGIGRGLTFQGEANGAGTREGSMGGSREAALSPAVATVVKQAAAMRAERRNRISSAMTAFVCTAIELHSIYDVEFLQFLFSSCLVRYNISETCPEALDAFQGGLMTAANQAGDWVNRWKKGGAEKAAVSKEIGWVGAE